MEAIIYLPGLGTTVTDQSINAFAHRYVKALDINDQNESNQYSYEVSQKKYGVDKNMAANVASIFVNNGVEKRHVKDIYELSYVDTLTLSFEENNVFRKTLILAGILFMNAPKIIRLSFRSIFFSKSRQGISSANPGQFVFSVVILILLSLFGLVLIASFPVLLSSLVDTTGMPEVIRTILNFKVFGIISLSGIYHILLGSSEFVIASFALFNLFSPNVRGFITEMATEFACMIRYLNEAKNRLNIMGMFESLLERIAENEKPYTEVSVVGYSFGSIIALDALFPMQGATSQRTANKVNNLVTIGCPFDFINMYWQKYYASREFTSQVFKKWFNVYSETDILSSNFRTDSLEGEANRSITENGIIPTNIPYHVLSIKEHSFGSAIRLMGLRAHGMYWEDQLNSASCLSSLISLKEKYD